MSPWIGRDARPIVDSLQELCERLRTIFARNPSHVDQPSHVYWFTSTVMLFVSDLKYVLALDGPNGRKTHRHLLQSLTDVLTIAQTISAKQIMDRSPKNSATFAYIALYSSESTVDSEHSIEHISESMNIGLDTIISDLQDLSDLTHLSFNPNSRAYFNIYTVGAVFAAMRHKVQGHCLENQHLGAWDHRITGHSKDVIKDYDSTLPQTMLCTAKRIFEIAYLPHFTDTYCSNLWMYNDGDSTLSVSLHIIPPSHGGSYSSVEERHLNQLDLPIVDFIGYAFHGWITEFHEHVFGRKGSSIISPYDWYPHLAAFLLIILVKNQYAALNANFKESSDWKTITSKFFLPFIKCLPYAIPTQQNLNALRALHYLCPKINLRCQWRPPLGFCSLAIDFLKKYDRSSLSSPEFDLLKAWLSGLMTRESRRIFQGVSTHHMLDDYTTDDGESSSAITDFDQDEEL
ncbi:hypothetical protein CVT25_013340 [Psilocybe cyanescens]|uniref:Uncharacterized protein n=1 Tax=Psilocybe cyanescens TaxID=93625 RepID=A0A409WT68_PSICY|nr:hypothetical protein CVT25_013340 [Psilocybe cyanescens]